MISQFIADFYSRPGEVRLIRDALQGVLDSAIHDDNDRRNLMKPNNFGWIFVHELVAELAPSIMRSAYGYELRLFHHVPKTGGTSIVNSINNETGYLQLFPMGTFEVMTKAYGIISVPNLIRQVVSSRESAFIFSGHYVLPDAIEYFALNTDAIGASIFAHPQKIISSGIRFYWDQVLTGSNTELADLDVELIQSAVHSLSSALSTGKRNSVAAAIRHTVSSKSFSNFLHDPLGRWYLGANVQNAKDVKEFFSLYRGIQVFEGPSVGITKLLTGISCKIGRDNVSSLSHDSFIAQIGASAFEDAIAECVGQSYAIYETLKYLSVKN